jgi:hypothetical protein
MLTNRETGAMVDFEIVMKPLPTQPRQPVTIRDEMEVGNIMKNVTRTFLLVFSSLLLLTYMATNVGAQNPNPTPIPRDGILINPNDRTLIVPRDGILVTPRDKIGNAERYSLIPPNTVTGKIRWRTEYGLPYNNSDAGRPVHPYPCGTGPFFLRSTTLVISERPGQTPTGTYKDVGNLTGEQSLSDAGTANSGGVPKVEGGYYVCRYAIVNLPLNRTIKLELDINPSYLPYDYRGFDRSVRLTAPWVGGTQPQPPPGYQRTIKGNRDFTLTNSATRATVDFEIVYEPIR